MTEIIRFTRQIRFDSIDLRAGMRIDAPYSVYLSGRAFETQDGNNAQRLASDVGLMFKLRRKNNPTVYDYFTICQGAVSINNKTILLQGSTSFLVTNDTDEVQVWGFVEPDPNTDGYTTVDVDRFLISDLQLTLNAVQDRPTQGY